jgi:hypothetical protein
MRSDLHVNESNELTNRRVSLSRFLRRQHRDVRRWGCCPVSCLRKGSMLARNGHERCSWGEIVGMQQPERLGRHGSVYQAVCAAQHEDLSYNNSMYHDKTQRRS